MVVGKFRRFFGKNRLFSKLQIGVKKVMEKNIRITTECKALIENVARNIGEDIAYCFRAVCRMFNSGRIAVNGDIVTICKASGDVVLVDVLPMYYQKPSVNVKVRTFIPLAQDVPPQDFRKAIAAVCLNAQANTKPTYTPQEIEGVDYVVEQECE